MNFIWKIAIMKGVKSAIKALIGIVGVSNLAQWGISIDQQVLAAAAIGSLDTLRNWLKVKKGIKFL